MLGDCGTLRPKSTGFREHGCQQRVDQFLRACLRVGVVRVSADGAVPRFPRLEWAILATIGLCRRDELMPFINANYPTDPADRAYLGHSRGGLFGLYTLFTKPDTFTRYIIGSPTIWEDDEGVLKLATDYVKTHDGLSATVFIGVGALEEDARDRMVTNVLRLETIL
jgi:hypothetical protein